MAHSWRKARRQLFSFFYDAFGHGLLIVSIPKAGTHLLAQLINSVGFRPPDKYRTTLLEYYGWTDSFWPSDSENRIQNELKEVVDAITELRPRRYLLTHLLPAFEILRSIEAGNVRVIFIYRDPRAVVLSHVNHVLRRTDSKFHHFYTQVLQTQEERIELAIRGAASGQVDFPIYWLPDIRTYFQTYLPWRECSKCLTVRFEDLIGPNGGGSSELQQATVARILRHLRIPHRSEHVKRFAACVFSASSPTFMKGQIDSWRTAFSDRNMASMMEIGCDLLAQLGYEK